jgi:hypothetical protein
VKITLTRNEAKVGYEDRRWMKVTQNYNQWRNLNLKFFFHCHASWLVNDSVSFGTIHRVDDRMNNEHGAVGGMRIDGETEVLGENLPQYHTAHHKSNMT